jgi:predicted porin
MFKKTAIALAVAGAYGASVPAQAVTVGQDGTNEVYGFVNISMDYSHVKNGGNGGNIFLPNTNPKDSSESSFQMGDQANSRFGFKGMQDLGNGLSAGYRIEIGMGTSAYNRGAPTEDTSHWDKRLAYVELKGNFGDIKAGNQWGELYSYLGYNTVRSFGFGGSTWYEQTRHLNYDGYGLRVSDALDYTYGSGGYGSDPFTFSVQGIFAPPNNTIGGSGGNEHVNDANGNPVDNTNTLDAITVAGAATFGGVTINAAYYTENNPGNLPQPKLWGIGARFAVTDALYLGGTFMELDRDLPAGQSQDKPQTIDLHADYSFGGGLSGMLGYGHGKNDSEGDLDSFFLQLAKDLGSGTHLYIEAEHNKRKVGGGAADPESTIVSTGMIKYF